MDTLTIGVASCSFVTTTADLHSAVELAKDTAAVPTPTASGAARFATACMPLASASRAYFMIRSPTPTKPRLKFGEW